MTMQNSKPLDLSKMPSQKAKINRELNLVQNTLYWWAFLKGRFACHRSRQHLLKLDDHHLRDIGITREQAQNEMNKGFWR